MIDLLKNPKLAEGDQILAIPTLVRKLPRRSRRSSATFPTRFACSWASTYAPPTHRRWNPWVKNAGHPSAGGRRRRKRAPKAIREGRIPRRPRVDTSFVLRCGDDPRSARPSGTSAEICEEHLNGRYDLEVIDIYQQPSLAEGEQIIAAPTLIKELPSPLRKLIGDMSDRKKILIGLDIRKKEGA